MPYIITYLCTSALFWASGTLLGFSGWLSVKEPLCQRHGFDPWSRRIPRAVEQLSPRATAAGVRVPRARGPQVPSPCAPGPVLRSKRSASAELQSGSPSSQLERDLCDSDCPAQPVINKQNRKPKKHRRGHAS